MSWNNSRCSNSNYPTMMDSEWRDAPFDQNDWDWITQLETKKPKKQLYSPTDATDDADSLRNEGIEESDDVDF